MKRRSIFWYKAIIMNLNTCFSSFPTNMCWISYCDINRRKLMERLSFMSIDCSIVSNATVHCCCGACFFVYCVLFCCCCCMCSSTLCTLFFTNVEWSWVVVVVFFVCFVCKIKLWFLLTYRFHCSIFQLWQRVWWCCLFHLLFCFCFFCLFAFVVCDSTIRCAFLTFCAFDFAI